MAWKVLECCSWEVMHRIEEKVNWEDYKVDGVHEHQRMEVLREGMATLEGATRVCGSAIGRVKKGECGPGGA